MNTYPVIRLILMLVAFMLLVIYHLVDISFEHQLCFFFISLLLTGIPHGSLDHLVHAKNNQQTAEVGHTSPHKFSFIKLYHGILVLYALLWFINPSAAVILFLIFSAYHFGELDWIWVRFGNRWIYALFTTLYGLLLLIITSLYHYSELQPTMQRFSGLHILKTAVLDRLFNFRFELLAILVVGTLGVIFYQMYERKARPLKYFIAIVQLLLLLAVLIKLPLLLGFGFYFSYWHSILTIASLVRYLKKKGEALTSVFKKGISNSVVATLLIAGVVVFASNDIIDHYSIIIFAFAGIAVLTAPHLVVISQMFDRMHRAKHSPLTGL